MSKDSTPKDYKLKRHQVLNPDQYVEGIRLGNISILSQAITLIESTNEKHEDLGQQIIEKCLPFSGNSIRIGITGVPGVGKSTFINTLGKQITSEGKKLAVLAIDPSSQRTKGSILGDKTRMEDLVSDLNAFIRPSPSAGSLGGVARATRETIILCEAAGFDVIFIETVGVGQSETVVHSMVDFFLLLMLAGAGDELQGIKRGIMEMADAIAINKADGDNLIKAKAARMEYENALHLFPASESGWIPKAEICSATANFNIDKIWEIIQTYQRHQLSSGYWQNKRKNQAKYWMHETINESLMHLFYSNPNIKVMIESLEKEVLENKTSPFKAAKTLMATFKI